MKAGMKILITFTLLFIILSGFKISDKNRDQNHLFNLFSLRSDSCLIKQPFASLINSVSSSFFEIFYSKDSDLDGLTDVEEEIYKTNKDSYDTDGDGRSDGEEVRFGYDPTIQGIDAKLVDTDEDGLADITEKLYGSDINNPDTDGDGYLDGNEVSHGYNPIIFGSTEDTRLPKRIDIDLSESGFVIFMANTESRGIF